MTYEMPLQEAIDRIDRIKRYAKYHADAGQPNHALSQDEVEKLVQSWGHDPKLAKGAGRIVIPKEAEPSKPEKPQPQDLSNDL
jgi:hypothetical protein